MLEPAGRRVRLTAQAERQAGFDPDVRYTSTDLQIQLRLVESELAVALLPELSGAENRAGVVARRLPGRPRRQIFTIVRRGAAHHPNIEAFIAALGRPVA